MEGPVLCASSPEPAPPSAVRCPQRGPCPALRTQMISDPRPSPCLLYMRLEPHHSAPQIGTWMSPLMPSFHQPRASQPATTPQESLPERPPLPPLPLTGYGLHHLLPTQPCPARLPTCAPTSSLPLPRESPIVGSRDCSKQQFYLFCLEPRLPPHCPCDPSRRPWCGTRGPSPVGYNSVHPSGSSSSHFPPCVPGCSQPPDGSGSPGITHRVVLCARGFSLLLPQPQMPLRSIPWAILISSYNRSLRWSSPSQVMVPQLQDQPQALEASFSLSLGPCILVSDLSLNPVASIFKT